MVTANRFWSQIFGVVSVAGLWASASERPLWTDRSMRCLACEVIACNAEITTAEAPALLVVAYSPISGGFTSVLV